MIRQTTHRRNIEYLVASYRLRQFIVALLCVLFSFAAFGQDTKTIKIKAFSDDLKPYGNIGLIINKGKVITLDERGSAFATLKKDVFPIKSIDVVNKKLEAASWNLTKGILEVTIRKKSYKDVTILIKDAQNSSVSNTVFIFKGEKTVTRTTNLQGSASLPLALNEKVENKDQFTFDNFNTLSLDKNDNSYVLSVEKIPDAKDQISLEVSKATNNDGVLDYDMLVSENLDSLNTLEEFYGFISQIDMTDISARTANSLDRKFESLLLESPGGNQDSSSYINQISDSTVIESDLKNLVAEAKREGVRINMQNSDFINKFSLVREKLNQGTLNLNESEKKKLLDDIDLLEMLLMENKNELYGNLSDYKSMINELKTEYFDIATLEDKLSLSEDRRKEERKLFQKSIIGILLIVLLFAALIVLLFYMWVKVKKQRKQLVNANQRVNQANQNLELLISERTGLLEKTFKELDMVLYKASHDLRAPICSIAGLSNLIALEANDAHLTNLILKTNDEMDRLLKKLSTISEIHQPGKLKETNVAKIINKVILHYSQQELYADVDFQLKCDNQLNVLTYPYLLEVIFKNLFENAFFFTSLTQNRKKFVVCEAKLENNILQILIRDNGLGIEEISLPKIFDMFYIGTENSRGNGLGLYIVSKALETLKGQIDVTSEAGIFTEFVIRIPVDKSAVNKLDFYTAERSSLLSIGD